MHALVAVAVLAQSAFAVDTLHPRGGPAVAWHRSPSPLVALRLSAPLPADLPRGVAELLQELARPAAEAAAREVGAALEMRVAGDEAVVAVSGPAAAFDNLAGILRAASAPPDVAAATLRAARARAEDRVLAALERPRPRLRALLRTRLEGTTADGAALDGLDPEAVRAFAAGLHRPDRLAVVLVGDVPVEVVRSAFTGWQPPRGRPADRSAAAAAALPRPQAHNAWAALAFPSQASPAVLAVAAELVRRRATAAGVFGGAAEAWEHRGTPALVVMGGVRPDDDAVAAAARISAFPGARAARNVSEVARFLRRLVAEAAALAGPGSVADAAATVRRRILLEARTPAGRAEVLARWSRRGSVEQVLEELAAIEAGAVQVALRDALARPALLAEVVP